jgi:ubiquinone/menaquinone biosynthesis C-methylase UbiE
VVGAAYEAVAEEYAVAFGDDLEQLPLDRSILDATVARLQSGEAVLDLGCGPGQVARYLADRDLRVVGLDLSPRMLALASHRAPRAGFVGGDMRLLPFRDGSFAAVVAFYSIQHVRRDGLGPLVGEMARVVVPNGLVVIAAHLGRGEVYVDELLGHTFEPFGGTLFSRQELGEALAAESLVEEVAEERSPLPHEHPSQRVYVIARRAYRADRAG